MAVKPRYDLGSGELDVLKILWDRGPSTVREVLEVLHERGRRVAYTTVLTTLTRLAAKGAVATDASEHAHVYRPRLSRQQVTIGRLKELVRDLYDGAAAPMVLQLMSSEKFTPDELSQLQKLIDDMDAGRKP